MSGEILLRKKEKVLRVYASKGGKDIDTRESSMYLKQNKLTGRRIDSTEAAKIALNAYKGTGIKSYWMGLGQGETSPMWFVKFGRKEKEPFWVEINASIGKVIKTRTGY